MGVNSEQPTSKTTRSIILAEKNDQILKLLYLQELNIKFPFQEYYMAFIP